MYRRSFLKMCGISGLLYATNWKTFIRGPKPGARVISGFITKRVSLFFVAGSQIKAGDFLMRGTDGQVHTITSIYLHPIIGVAMSDTDSGVPCETLIAGSMEVINRKKVCDGIVH